MQVTIAVGASLSSEAILNAQRPAAVYVPADTEGAVLTFQGWVDEATGYKNIYDKDGEVSIAFTADTVVALPLEKMLWAQKIKIRTGTAGAPTNQSGAIATLTLLGA